jgi:hypothetical protein
MAVRNPPARLNRIVLAVAGLLFVAAGGYALAAYYDRLGWVDARSPLVADPAVPPARVLWAVAAVAAGLGLACLRWVAAQRSRAPRSERWRARTPDSLGTTVLSSTAVAAPTAADVETYDGVRSARAWLSGPGRVPVLHLVVTADPDADIAALRRRIRTHAIPRLCQALEVEIIPVTMELRPADCRR